MTVDFDELRKLNAGNLVDPLSAQWQPSSLDGLRRQIVNDFQERWAMNDPAHRYRHFSEVEAVANYINYRQNLGIDSTLIMLAAFFHDLFAWTRYNHHRLSAEWIRTTDYSIIAALSGDEREQVAQACEHHRASGIGMHFPCRLAELICAADRGWPGSLQAMVNRCIAGYSGANPEAPKMEILSHVVLHMREKFGVHGYARLPVMYAATFGDIVHKRQLAFDNLVIIDESIVVEDIPFTPIV